MFVWLFPRQSFSSTTTKLSRTKYQVMRCKNKKSWTQRVPSDWILTFFLSPDTLTTATRWWERKGKQIQPYFLRWVWVVWAVQLCPGHYGAENHRAHLTSRVKSRKDHAWCNIDYFYHNSTSNVENYTFSFTFLTKSLLEPQVSF